MRRTLFLSRMPMWLRLFLLGGILSAIYSAVTPPWQAPDEPLHFEYVRLLYQEGRLVGWADADPELEREIVASMDRHDFWRLGLVKADIYDPESTPQLFSDLWGPGPVHELHQPPMAYILYAAVLPATQGMDPATQLRWMRVISVILGALSVCVAYWATREVFPEDTFLQIGVPAFIALLPMHAYLAGTLNNDHLAELVGSSVILLLAVGIRRGFSAPRLVGVAGLLVLGVLTKRSTLPLVPASLCAVVLGAWARRGIRRIGWVIILGSASTLVGAILIASFWPQLRESLASVAPILAQEADKLLYVYVFFIFRPLDQHQRTTTLADLFAPGTSSYYIRYARQLLETFWARFGWLNVWLAKGLRVFLAIVSLAGVGGLIRFAAKTGRESPAWPRWKWACVFMLLLCVLFAFALLAVQMYLLWDEAHRPGPQARYLFPQIVAIGMLFMLGVREWVPPEGRSTLLRVWLAGMGLLNVTCLAVYIIPYYHG